MSDAVVRSLHPRPLTPDVRTDAGLLVVTVKRCCNGCGRTLGDATTAELEGAIGGLPLPDVRAECGCSQSAHR